LQGSPAVCGRGLKLFRHLVSAVSYMSPAVCGRGLKLHDLLRTMGLARVARRVRAWIETCLFRVRTRVRTVARRVRAWIETAG